ncbi:hypothetical protein K488DRAFT_18358, partial [Vararia minispora EC-137]
WLKQYSTERWEKKFNARPERAEVLVLKTEFNSAWNYFSASELGNTIFGYWREYLQRADSSDWLFPSYPWPSVRDKNSLEREGVLAQFLTPVRVQPGSDEFLHVVDLRKLSIWDRRMITSRKRTRNMFDFTSLWKNIVFSKLDEREGEAVDPPEER